MLSYGIKEAPTLPSGHPSAHVSALKWEGKHEKKINKRVPLEQATKNYPIQTHYTQSGRGFPSTFFTSGAKWSDQLTQKAFAKLNAIILKFTITTASNSVRLVPTTQWFSRIDVYQDNKLLATIYPEMLEATIMMLERQKLEATLSLCGQNLDFSPSRDLASGVTKDFYLPLLGSIFNRSLFWGDAKSDLRFEFTPPNGSTIIASGSGTITSPGMSFLVQTEDFSSKEVAIWQGVHAQEVSSHCFLEPMYQKFSSQTLTASAKTNFVMDSISGNIAYLLVAIRSTSAAQASNGYQNYIGLGPDALIDVLSPSGSSVLGSGSAIPEAYLVKNVLMSHFDSPYWYQKKLYLIPFCKDVRSAVFGGVMDGVYNFNSGREQLSLTPDSASTSEVHTITQNAALTSGVLQLEFKGIRTAQFAYNETAANIKALIDAMDVFLYAPGGPITSTVSATFAAGTSVTITLAGMANSYPDNINTINVVNCSMETGSNAAASATTAISTRGIPGFTTGTYNVEVWAMKHRMIDSHLGRFSVEDY